MHHFYLYFDGIEKNVFGLNTFLSYFKVTQQIEQIFFIQKPWSIPRTIWFLKWSYSGMTPWVLPAYFFYSFNLLVHKNLVWKGKLSSTLTLYSLDAKFFCNSKSGYGNKMSYSNGKVIAGIGTGLKNKSFRDRHKCWDFLNAFRKVDLLFALIARN